MISVTLDACKMLEAALEQMDGIISGATANAVFISGNGNGTGNGDSDGGGREDSADGGSSSSNMIVLNERNRISTSNVLATAKTLALALQQVEGAAPAPDSVTAAIIKDWLDMNGMNEGIDERLKRLHKEKENVTLENEKLTERLSEQTDKIIELEKLLTEKTQQLSVKEDELQRELLLKSASETQQLMILLSKLKWHRAVLERGNIDLLPENDNDNSLQFFSLENNVNLPEAKLTPKTPPASSRHQIHPQFHSLPRSYGTKNGNNHVKCPFNNNNNSNRVLDANANTNNVKQRNVVFASNEKIYFDEILNGRQGNDLMQNSFISQSNSSRQSPIITKSFRHILGKFKRSHSGNLELPEQSDGEFRRGGARATAGGRIEWSTQTSQISNASKDYTDWSVSDVINWLRDLDLGCYVEDCMKWLTGNQSVCFFTASPVDIEKELNIKVPLHRKKILLAIDELVGKENDILALKASNLNVTWVLRWLDDIGLPQYKESFLEAKIDGRMLHRLTLEDLAQLHVYSCLHIASLHRGIQCMREMEWQPDCLIRRSTGNSLKSEQNDSQTEINTSKQSNDSSNESTSSDATNNEFKENIALWTAHRVMEWLRVADLSEYAPNLRGAGVHGALMRYENRFNANLLADLLSIPPSKSLLRRHLATQFKELLGRNVIQKKRDAAEAPGYQPLSLTAKIKPPKKSQFALIRRKSNKGSSDIEWSDYVCPMMSFCQHGVEKNGKSYSGNITLPNTNGQDSQIGHNSNSSSNNSTTNNSTSLPST